MPKFTVFSVLLAVIVTVVVAQTLADNYFGEGVSIIQPDETGSVLPKDIDLSKVMGTNVLGEAAGQASEIVGNSVNNFTDAAADAAKDSLKEAGQNFTNEFGGNLKENFLGSGSGGASSDFEDSNFVAIPAEITLRDDQIRSAGFAQASLGKEDHDGYLFKNIYVGDLSGVESNKVVIASDSQMFAKVQVFSVGPSASVDELYEVLQVRVAGMSGVEVNETNQFGDASFYMNDSSRSGTVFLLTKINKLLYAFSYPRDYHQQIKNLISLIVFEQ